MDNSGSRMDENDNKDIRINVIIFKDGFNYTDKLNYVLNLIFEKIINLVSNIC